MRYTHGPICREHRGAAALIALALLLAPMRIARAEGEQAMPFTTPETPAEEKSAGDMQSGNTVAPEQTLYETVSPHTQLDFPMDAVASPQSIDGTVPMFLRADEGSEVLMEYYSGARLTALHPAGSGF